LNKHQKQELLNLLKTAYDTLLPFYQRINSLNKRKNSIESNWESFGWLGFLFGIPLAVLAFRLCIRITAYIHTFYVNSGPFPFHLYAPLWVEILLFLGALVMIIVSFFTPVAVMYTIPVLLSSKKHDKVSAEINAEWHNLRAVINGWPDCPVTIEYSHPQWIAAIYNTIDAGRADSIIQAIHVLEAYERHRQLINAQMEVQRAYMEEQKRKQRRKEAEDDFELLFWLNEML
jgi:hypothetical protein